MQLTEGLIWTQYPCPWQRCSIVVTTLRSQNQSSIPSSGSSNLSLLFCRRMLATRLALLASSVVCLWPPYDWERKLQSRAIVFLFCHSRLARVLEWHVCLLRCRSWDNEMKSCSFWRLGWCHGDSSLDLTCLLCFYGHEDCKLCGCFLSLLTFLQPPPATLHVPVSLHQRCTKF